MDPREASTGARAAPETIAIALHSSPGNKLRSGALLALPAARVQTVQVCADESEVFPQAAFASATRLVARIAVSVSV